MSLFFANPQAFVLRGSNKRFIFLDESGIEDPKSEVVLVYDAPNFDPPQCIAFEDKTMHLGHLEEVDLGTGYPDVGPTTHRFGIITDNIWGNGHRCTYAEFLAIPKRTFE